jgi:hypothetical protein
LPTVPSDCLTKAQKECEDEWAKLIDEWEEKYNGCYYDELIGCDFTLCTEDVNKHYGQKMEKIKAEYKQDIKNCGGI